MLNVKLGVNDLIFPQSHFLKVLRKYIETWSTKLQQDLGFVVFISSTVNLEWPKTTFSSKTSHLCVTFHTPGTGVLHKSSALTLWSPWLSGNNWTVLYLSDGNRLSGFGWRGIWVSISMSQALPQQHSDLLQLLLCLLDIWILMQHFLKIWAASQVILGHSQTC